MIYVHVIFEIHSAKTDKLLKTDEKLLKFKDENRLNQYSFDTVKMLERNRLQYPGNGKMYVDFSTRTLSDEEIKFCGLPA